jgi:hypothetical protein
MSGAHTGSQPARTSLASFLLSSPCLRLPAHALRDTSAPTPPSKASVSVLARSPMSSTPTVRLSSHAPPVRMPAAASASTPVLAT